MNTRLRIALGFVLLGVSSLAMATGFTWGTSTTANDALLTAPQAFAMQPPSWQGRDVELRWTIAPGYYLYRGRIHVKPVAANAPAGRLELPPAQAHEDAAFGKVHIYREQLVAHYVPASTSAAPQQLEVTVQGCADRGVCYPPLTRVVTLPPAPAAAQ